MSSVSSGSNFFHCVDTYYCLCSSCFLSRDFVTISACILIFKSTVIYHNFILKLLVASPAMQLSVMSLSSRLSSKIFVIFLLYYGSIFFLMLWNKWLVWSHFFFSFLHFHIRKSRTSLFLEFRLICFHTVLIWVFLEIYPIKYFSFFFQTFQRFITTGGWKRIKQPFKIKFRHVFVQY